MATDSQLLGIAGVHLVCAELTLKNYIAILTSRNTAGIDILVSNQGGSKYKSIQVKTTRKNKDWFLNEKLEEKYSENFIYIFVNIDKNNKAEFHIVPSKIVAETIKSGFKKWLDTPNKQGNPHNNTPARNFRDRENKYLNRWDLLGLD